MSFFPFNPVPDPAGMNWAIAIFAFMAIVAMFDYYVKRIRVMFCLLSWLRMNAKLKRCFDGYYTYDV